MWLVPLVDAVTATPATAVAAILAVALGLLVAALAGLGAPALRAPAVTAAREVVRRAEATRQRDPDAAGRPRPRAPTALPAAA